MNNKFNHAQSELKQLIKEIADRIQSQSCWQEYLDDPDILVIAPELDIELCNKIIEMSKKNET